jgi:U4/U6 small nuclear ribonucleoprotein PRP4
VYRQETHHKPVYSVSFHHDGSLICSGGSDAICRVWDIRTGRAIMTLEGHAEAVLTLDFSPDGFHLVSGSLDGFCQIWDLRKAKCEYTLPAHTKLVSSARYHPTSCHFLITAGYDREARIWSVRHPQLLQILSGHSDKITGVDINQKHKNLLACATYSQCFYTWSNQFTMDTPGSRVRYPTF